MIDLLLKNQDDVLEDPFTEDKWSSHVLFSGQMSLFQWEYSSSAFKSLLKIKLKLYITAFFVV